MADASSEQELERVAAERGGSDLQRPLLLHEGQASDPPEAASHEQLLGSGGEDDLQDDAMLLPAQGVPERERLRRRMRQPSLFVAKDDLQRQLAAMDKTQLREAPLPAVSQGPALLFVGCAVLCCRSGCLGRSSMAVPKTWRQSRLQPLLPLLSLPRLANRPTSASPWAAPMTRPPARRPPARGDARWWTAAASRGRGTTASAQRRRMCPPGSSRAGARRSS